MYMYHSIHSQVNYYVLDYYSCRVIKALEKMSSPQGNDYTKVQSTRGRSSTTKYDEVQDNLDVINGIDQV